MIIILATVLQPVAFLFKAEQCNHKFLSVSIEEVEWVPAWERL
jgi:hypothetical protein